LLAFDLFLFVLLFGEMILVVFLIGSIMVLNGLALVDIGVALTVI